ncbi:MAG: YbgA family protein, partial [Verrucomicrobia bacterium]|nr:YbgA family protein [Verrucomicrobiota bacterium]
KQVNVLQHVMGFFKKQLTPDEKQELLDVFEQYRRRTVPLIVPVTLLNHYVRLCGSANRSIGDYLAQQYYLHPHPIELSLRSTI